jgi:hypothetical protein
MQSKLSGWDLAGWDSLGQRRHLLICRVAAGQGYPGYQDVKGISLSASKEQV